MLAYVANRPRIGARQSSPNAMMFVICAHLIVIAVVLSAKMSMPRPINSPIPIISVPIAKAPPLRPPAAAPAQPPAATFTKAHQRVVTVAPTPAQLPANSGNNEAEPIAIGSLAIPALPPLLPRPFPASSDAQLLTPLSDLKPPYPETKLMTGEEASLTLRLSIDEHGQVTAVDPVGRVDPVFLAAARRHLLEHWRYKPAMKDGRAVASTTVVTLHFELDG